MGKPLTAELIAQKSKNDNMYSIKNLNLWGNDIDDLKVLRQLPNLEVLSLSVNKISTLKDIAVCTKLQELYLRKNLVSDIKELRYLQPLQYLKVLWLQDNPCADIPNYREVVMQYLPNLTKLDNTTISAEDRTIGKSFNILSAEEPQPIQANPSILSRPKSMQKESPKKSQQQPFESFKHTEDRNNNVDNQKQVDRNENILCAVLALVKEMDDNSLEVVKRDIERKLASKNKRGF